MGRIRCVGASRDRELENRLKALAARFGLRNVFNPSPAEHGAKLFIAFRAISPEGGRVRGYLAQFDESGDALVDLTSFANRHDISWIADPKLLTLGEDVFVTFNTGFSSEDPNAIYLQRVTPQLGVPQVCLLDPRQRVEKNWAFFCAGDELQAVYSLQPLVFLSLNNGQLDDGGPLSFKRRDSKECAEPARLTIGSQMLTDGGRGLLVAHSKVKVGRRRAYMGHVVEIDLVANEARAIVSPVALIDSWRALLPARERLNPNLWSATYFSGITRSRDQFLLGYGVNDSGAALARVSREAIT